MEPFNIDKFNYAFPALVEEYQVPGQTRLHLVVHMPSSWEATTSKYPLARQVFDKKDTFELEVDYWDDKTNSKINYTVLSMQLPAHAV